MVPKTSNLQALTECLFVGRGMIFVDWCHNLCIDNLLPGACYQRRKGSLDLLHVIYDSLIYCPDNRQRKGYTPGKIKGVRL